MPIKWYPKCIASWERTESILSFLTGSQNSDWPTSRSQSTSGTSKCSKWPNPQSPPRFRLLQTRKKLRTCTIFTSAERAINIDLDISIWSLFNQKSLSSSSSSSIYSPEPSSSESSSSSSSSSSPSMAMALLRPGKASLSFRELPLVKTLSSSGSRAPSSNSPSPLKALISSYCCCFLIFSSIFFDFFSFSS